MYSLPEGELRLKLLPCPFCGVSGHTYLHRWPNGETRPNMFLFHTENCIFEHLIESFDDFPDEQALANAWNTRYGKEGRR